VSKAVFPDLSRYDAIGLDTETTGLKRKDKAVGLSYALPDGNKHYLRWGHEAGGNNCSIGEVRDWVDREFKRPDLVRVFFNTQFDVQKMHILGVDLAGGVMEDPGTAAALINEHEPERSLGYFGKKYLNREKSDTELNARCAAMFGGKPTRDHQAENYHRAPGDWVAEYAEDDADLTLALRDRLDPVLKKQNLEKIYNLECLLLPVLIKMHRAGVRVDPDRATKIWNQLDREMFKLSHEWNKLSGGFKFSQRNKMIELLLSLGITPPRKPPTARMLEKGKKEGNYSVDKSFLESLDHPVGALVRRMRQVTHYRDTFVQGYVLDNVDEWGLIYPQFWPTRSEFGGTITGRFSSAGELNIQNVPARDEEWAALIRQMFVPITNNHLWLRADYSQIEYRFFAHYAGGKMRQAYLDNPLVDFHDMVATMTGLKRKAAKSINFAKLYGAGIAKLALSIGCSEAEAREFVKLYEARIPESVKVYNKAMNLASQRGYVMTWAGRISRFRRDPERGFFQKTHAALNKVLQGSSADLTKMAMIELDHHIDWDESPMHLTVHDELDFSIPKGGRGVELGRMIKGIMEDYELTVPIVAEAEVGDDWGHLQSLDEYAASPN